MSNDLITQQTSNAVIFSADKAGELMRFAEFMAQGSCMIPAHLQGKPADCMAVALQSAAWNMSPFAVAQKTHLVNGTLGYEAQLVNAVVTSSRAVVGRFHYEYIGDWSKWSCKSKNVGTQQQPKWKYEYFNEGGLAVRVGAVLAGETEITWGEYVYIEHVRIRNSPLWQTMPKQQIAYLAVKYFARLYCPEILLGVYTPDELYAESEYNVNKDTEKVINPQASEIGIDDVFNSQQQSNIEATQNEKTNAQYDEATQAKSIDDIFNQGPVDSSETQAQPELDETPTKAQMLIDQIGEVETIGQLQEIGQYMHDNGSQFIEGEFIAIKNAFQKTKTRLGA